MVTIALVSFPDLIFHISSMFLRVVKGADMKAGIEDITWNPSVRIDRPQFD